MAVKVWNLNTYETEGKMQVGGQPGLCSDSQCQNGKDGNGGNGPYNPGSKAEAGGLL